jgi:hypothetical protein
MKIKFEKQKHHYDNWLSISYCTTDSESKDNQLHITLRKIRTTITLPPIFKGKPDEWGALSNCGFYFSIGSEFVYFNYGVDFNDSRKNHSWIFEYPWNVQYIRDSEEYLDRYFNICDADTDGSWDFEWDGGYPDMFNFYEVIDPYNGNKNIIKCYLKRSQYIRGSGILKKLFHVIFKPFYIYRLEVNFKEEFGRGVWTWNGGTHQYSHPTKHTFLQDAVVEFCEYEGIKYCSAIDKWELK